jgi:hypothetical protein
VLNKDFAMPDSTALSLVDPKRTSDWNLILLNTRKMLEAAHCGDWELVVTLESVRRKSISLFFATGVAPYEAQHVKRGIEEILAADRRLLALTKEQRALAKANIVQFKRRVNAGNVYAANSAA